MDRRNRRQFIGDLTRFTIAALVFPWSAGAGTDCHVVHPLVPPDPAFHGRCPNCGMMRSMWARTWKMFRPDAGLSEACSFHCLADMMEKSGRAFQDVKTALFLQPRGMITAKEAWYVVGSSARGTMTMMSKAAFPSRSMAADFAQTCGGEIADYDTTFQLARKALAKENAMIDRKRLARKKIIPPVDIEDECVVCHMYPARYPRHCSQVSYGGSRVDHFCSTHCLFSWLSDPKNDPSRPGFPGMIWVTDYGSGRWISGRTAFFVMDSRTMGPMGAEAIAFDRYAQAADFSRKKGGTVMTFEKVISQAFAGPS